MMINNQNARADAQPSSSCHQLIAAHFPGILAWPILRNPLLHPLPSSSTLLSPSNTLLHPVAPSPGPFQESQSPNLHTAEHCESFSGVSRIFFLSSSSPPRICICICICMDLSGLSPIQADKRKWTSKPIQLRRIDSSSLTIELAKLRPESVDPVWP